MMIDYAYNLDLILNELRPSTPATVAKLNELRLTYDSTAAFYAAFIVLCLQSDVDRSGIDALDYLTSYERVKGYTYFEYLGDNSLAWKRLEAVLGCFCTELKAH